MKDTVLKREMFVTPMSKKTMNSGIMAGFEEDEDMMEEGMAEEMPPMTRSPQNPEILMNNLRGDIRSIDARYLELAQMVGEEAAMETPPEVLAMLQGQMGAQAAPPPPAGGIGALPQAPEMGAGPMMPSGMEGAAPFPQGGAEQAPPTPDGMPPLRAATGMEATQENRFNQAQQNLQFEFDRMLDLASGNIPPEQMTDTDRALLQRYNMAMGFTGGTIRDVAQQGATRIGSALAPYAERGRQMLTGLGERAVSAVDQFMPNFQGFRVTPLRGPDGGRVVVQGRENIVPGKGGMPVAGAGTKLQGANTINIGEIPFSQAVRESFSRNPRLTTAATTFGVGSTAAALMEAFDRNKARPFPPGSPEQAQQTADRLSQIPNEFAQKELSDTSPSLATINVVGVEPPIDLSTPFDTKRAEPLVPLQRETKPITFPTLTTTPSKEEIKQVVQAEDKKEQPIKTRAERIKEEYATLEPTFRELLGDTKSDIRANAYFLLADAGFKVASTYKPTMAMAFGEAFSGVPRGFAGLAAQAKDRGIKIRTAALQQATDNINLQDKYARDIQLESLKIQGNFYRDLLKARTQQDLEKVKAGYKQHEILLQGDVNAIIEQIKTGGEINEDAGMGLVVRKKKNGSFLGAFIPTDEKGQLPPVVRGAVDSRWTLRTTDNPFVDNRGLAPTTVETDKAERVKLGASLRGVDDSLRLLDDLRGQYVQLYSPGTFVTDKINNVIVPVSTGLVRPDVNQTAAASRINIGLNNVMKRLAAANDQGRVAVQEQEWARDMLGGLTNPTAFFGNKEIAAKQFATMETQLRNARQQLLTQLGYVADDLTMNVPSTGTKSDPFVIPADQAEQQRMFRYLASTIGTSQDPRASVYIQMPNGRVEQFNPVQLRGLVQK